MKSLTKITAISFFVFFMGGCYTDGQFSQYGRSGGLSGGFYDQTGGIGYALGGLAQQAITPGMVRGGALGALVGVATRKDIGRAATTGALIGAGLEMLSQAGQPRYGASPSSNPGVEGAYHQGYGQGRQELQRDLEQNAYNTGRAAGYGYR